MEPMTLREKAMLYLNNHLGLGLPNNPSAGILVAAAQLALLEEVKEELQEIKELLREE